MMGKFVRRTHQPMNKSCQGLILLSFLVRSIVKNLLKFGRRIPVPWSGIHSFEYFGDPLERRFDRRNSHFIACKMQRPAFGLDKSNIFLMLAIINHFQRPQWRFFLRKHKMFTIGQGPVGYSHLLNSTCLDPGPQGKFEKIVLVNRRNAALKCF